SLVRHVEAADRRVTLSGAAFGEASAVIYRNAVLIETKLVEPTLRGSSLMAAAPAKAVAPPPAAPEPAKPIVVELPPRSQPQAQSTLESRPAVASAASTPSKHLSTASLAKIDAARCTAAAQDLGKDPWELAALGDHALCLIDSGKESEAKAKLHH